MLAVEGAYSIKKFTKNPQPMPYLSMQEILDCLTNSVENVEKFDRGYGIEGCDGGSERDIWAFYRDFGATSQGVYPSSGSGCRRGSVLRIKKAGEDPHGIESWDQSSCNLSKMQQELANSPLVISLDYSCPSLRFYQSGILSSADCECTGTAS